MYALNGPAAAGILTATQQAAASTAVKQAATLAAGSDDFYFGDPNAMVSDAWGYVTGANPNYFPDQNWFNSYIAKQNTASPKATKSTNYALIAGGALALFFLLKG